MLMPFYPNLGDRLRKLASNFWLPVWFTYPGNVTDMFTQHRGRTHKSKSRNSVYCCYCKCTWESRWETWRFIWMNTCMKAPLVRFHSTCREIGHILQFLKTLWFWWQSQTCSRENWSKLYVSQTKEQKLATRVHPLKWLRSGRRWQSLSKTRCPIQINASENNLYKEPDLQCRDNPSVSSQYTRLLM